ncbi:MAG: TIGR01459 family HAD-type hydrolase [Acetobacteraceae bacterium]|nr:TIGR01459 family HAD-type hydrolase [Acetobacteraceae bacterium]
MQHLSGFAPLAQRYDGFIVDLWGVLHDGVSTYPGAVDCLARLKAMGKPAVLLSNAPRRSYVAQKPLRAMGITDDLYTGLLTSGEVTWRALRDRTDPFVAQLGRRLYHLGEKADRNVFECLCASYEEVDRLEDADFIVNTGPSAERGLTEVAPYMPTLERALALGLPMVCANPDLEVIRGGIHAICAGRLAQVYETMGGRVRRFGKPDPAVYAPVLEMLALRRERVLALGDGLRTDIAGAAAAGVDSCWVLNGIARELRDNLPAAEAEAKAAGLHPVATIPELVW